MATPVDYDDLEFTRPANQIKVVNVPPIPQRIFDGMKEYEDAARGFDVKGYERTVKNSAGEDVLGGIILSHRPADAQVAQIFRMPIDPATTELERLTYFDIGAGRTISAFIPIVGDDWRGVYRAGGAIMMMDLDGNEHFQLWRYWEDSLCQQVLPKIDGELDNTPGKGRFERLTHDDYRYGSITISPSNKLMAFVSNKENNTDTLAYLTCLIGSKTGAGPDSAAFSLPSRLTTPRAHDGITERWSAESFSLDDRYLLLTRLYANSYRPLYLVNISGAEPGKLERIVLPGATERDEETVVSNVSFSLERAKPHVAYFTTNAYGDFDSVVSFDIGTRTITHITTAGLDPSIHVLRSIPWRIQTLKITDTFLYFTANVEGWCVLYVLPLFGTNTGTVIEIQLNWEGGWISFAHNGCNGRPHQLALRLASHRARGFVRELILDLKTLKCSADGGVYVDAAMTPYMQTSVREVKKALPPKLIRFKSFDGLEVPAMYYHPSEGQSRVPAVIGIHGGPESQATVQYRTAIHGYLLNELGIAVIYPNVRGSSGYGKRYMAADDVLKREDAVKDIGALLDYIGTELYSELNKSQIAVMGGSYGGYMVFATLSHYSAKLTCGVANFGVAHWVNFLQNTAAVRRALRRREYGDETVPEIRAFLERISPLNNAEKITVPLLITHGENDSRVTVHEAVSMFKIVRGRPGGQAELVICEKEGHGYKQKSVIEYVNAATILFLERFLLSVPSS